MSPRPIPALVLAIALAAASAAAQPAPLSIVIAANPPIAIAPNGALSTLAPFGADDEITAVTTTPDNRGLLFGVHRHRAGTIIAQRVGGVLTTLATGFDLPSPASLRVDSRGNILVTGTTPFGFAGSGDLVGNAFTLKFESIAGHPTNVAPMRASIDPITDEILCVTAMGEVMRLGREIPASINTISASSSYAYPGGVGVLPRAWQLAIEGTGGDFWIFDRIAETKHRFHDAPSDVVDTIDWVVDPVRNALVVLRERAAGHELVTIDLDTAAVSTLWSGTTALPNRPIALAGGRVLGHASGRPRVGEAYRMRVSAPTFPNAFYLVAASMSPVPGVRIANRHFPATPDALFNASLTKPTVFENFSGALDANGEAIATYHVEPAVAGLRIYFAVAIVTNATIRAVSLPYGVSIEPAS